MGAENVNLLPCPFCGSTDPSVVIARSNDPHDTRQFWAVYCYHCEARGSLKLDLATACVGWNVALSPKPEGMRKALEGIAARKLPDELGADDDAASDYRAGWTLLIEEARAALAANPEKRDG